MNNHDKNGKAHENNDGDEPEVKVIMIGEVAVSETDYLRAEYLFVAGYTSAKIANWLGVKVKDMTAIGLTKVNCKLTFDAKIMHLFAIGKGAPVMTTFLKTMPFYDEVDQRPPSKKTKTKKEFEKEDAARAGKTGKFRKSGLRSVK
ncbi:hypothetical protein [Photobacterium profundum]|jgi:hypothetical protein|uniref:Uncharacterized protein n=1 Tax=Photobacterium profundum 3TCK TaxID=314280 RepID=Q1Z5E8_9GAMM|nr:hypothetical protein [Photobacterium profundum]EAS43618.1 hypothetical protein P3TCK_17602 [Photobacterium profundum 3TCK]